MDVYVKVFQFHNGSIKSKVYITTTKMDEMQGFQFHNGSIKRQDLADKRIIMYNATLFQFHNGSIKSSRNTQGATHGFCNSGFNSTMVRLKVRTRQEQTWIPCNVGFNSTMVRLKERSSVDRVFHYLIKFQFHNGSIKSRYASGSGFRHVRSYGFQFHNGSIKRGYLG